MKKTYRYIFFGYFLFLSGVSLTAFAGERAPKTPEATPGPPPGAPNAPAIPAYPSSYYSGSSTNTSSDSPSKEGRPAMGTQLRTPPAAEVDGKITAENKCD